MFATLPTAVEAYRRWAATTDIVALMAVDPTAALRARSLRLNRRDRPRRCQSIVTSRVLLVNRALPV